MATSSAMSTSNTYIKYKIKVTENSTSTSNNTSNVTVTVNFYRTNTGYTTYGSGTVYCTIDGTQYTASVTSSQKITSDGIDLFTKTLDISHNSDGSKSLTVSAYISHSQFTSDSQSFTTSLTTIARASSITSASNVTLGNACSVKWTPASSSFAYKINFSAGGYSTTTGYISPGTTSAYTYTGYTFSIATWAPYLSGTSTTMTCTATLYTYTSSSSSSSIGTSTQTFTLTLSSSAASSISSASGVTLGNACSVKWTPQSKSFAYKLKFVASSGSYTTGFISPNSTSAYTYTGYTFDVATWAKYITSGTTLSCTATLYTYVNSSASSSLGSATATFTLTLSSSSASSISSASSVTLGNACSVKWTPASSSFVYKLKFSAGDYSYTSGYISPSTTSAYTYTGYTFSTSTWAPYITSATTATCTATLYTYVSSSTSTSLGSATKTFTLTVPSSCTPTASLTVSEGNSDVSSSSISVYLNGKSKIKAAVTATMSYSSAISSIAVTVGSTSYSPSITTTSTGATATVTSGTISSSSVTVSVTVTDKRGRTGTASKTVSLSTYSNPSIDTFTVARCDEEGGSNDNGEYVKVVYKYTVSNVSGNTSSALIQYKKATASSYGTTLISESGTFSRSSTTYISTATFSTESGYDFRLTLTDALSSATKTARISTGSVVMDFLSDGTGMAIGKVSETSGLFDIAWRTRIQTSQGSPQLRVMNTNDTGGTYIRVENWSGRMISFGIGSGGENRGIYDMENDKWLLRFDLDGNTRLAYPSGTYKPYYAAGDTISSGMNMYTAGFVSSSSANIYFTIPLTRPILGSPTVTLSGGLILVQNNSYTHGSASGSPVTPSSWSVSAAVYGLQVVATMASTTNATNNSPIGIRTYNLSITLS